MADTPNLHLPYPAEAAPADVPLDIQALAEAIDAYGLSFATPGDLKLSAAIAAPAGWLVCDGRAVSRGTYAALFAAVGTSYGAGDGAATFNLPDFRGRAPIGAGAGPGLTARALGAVGGEEAHGLSTAEMPSHAHGVSNPGHAHALADPGHAHAMQGRADINTGNTGNWIAVVGWGVGGGGTGAAGTGMGVYGAATGVGVQANGGGGVHNNMAPFAAVNVLIKF